MRHRSKIVVLAASVCVIASAVGLLRPHPVARVSGPSSAGTAPADTRGHASPVTHTAAALVPARIRDLHAAFKSAPDLAAFADSLRQDANAGDARAQYFLWATLRYCEEHLRFAHLKTRDGARPLEEARMRFLKRSVPRSIRITGMPCRPTSGTVRTCGATASAPDVAGGVRTPCELAFSSPT